MALLSVGSPTARWFAECLRMTAPAGTSMGSVGVGSPASSERMASPMDSPMVSHGMDTLESMG